MSTASERAIGDDDDDVDGAERAGGAMLRRPGMCREGTTVVCEEWMCTFSIISSLPCGRPSSYERYGNRVG